uniref:Uveal autoantigen with coiled-coil domains and ankyrin repeats n=1 Tax=Gasterosteus aculeatus aculeatus TaxID=481459 RepID=A0AAQ4S0D6_GASAC
MSRWLKCTSMHFNTDWNKYDDRLMKAVERREVDKVAAVLSKKAIIPSKLDVEGHSAFHLAATRGHLDCLNLILAHGVDVTASDATGKNALHQASRNGHSLCVQKLLQHNSPVGNVDLQGRTALHDAVMGGCSSSVKLLCDSGASVNATDFDGRTPLVLATQMCHPRICQLLLERGADITIRDKLNKTALILGCEFGCKDAVEVLLKSGSDVKAVDGLGQDALHYARLNKNPELVTLIKSHLDKATRAVVLVGFSLETLLFCVLFQDFEKQNEALQESLRNYQQDQRALLDQVNVLQQHGFESHSHGSTSRNQLKRSIFSNKVHMKMNVNSNKIQFPHILQVLQNLALSHSLSRPSEKNHPSVGWHISAELDALQRELEAVKRRQQAADEETAQLQSALNRKTRECQELVLSRDTIQKQADQQIQGLEDALGDVQKRMLDSECKVKQLQAHVVAVKEHLGGQATEELRAQLQDVKAKYEGASAEVCRVRNRLKQSEKALEEYKSSENQLATEAEKLNQELAAVTADRDDLAIVVVEMEAHLKETQSKCGNTVPAEKFDNMKNLLSNAVDEKERQIAELREDYDRVLEEVAELNRKLDGPSSRGAAGAVQAALEQQNASLKRRLSDVTAKSQALIQEVEESEEEREMLREQLDELNSRIQMDYVPVNAHDEARRNMASALEELEDKLVEAGERCGKAEAQVQQLQSERPALQANIGSLRSASERHLGEVDALRSQNADLTKKLELLQRRCEDGDRECARLTTQSQTLQRSLEGEYVPRRQHEQVKMELESAEAERLKLETKGEESGEELKNVKERHEKLKEKFEKVQLEMRRDYVSVEEHKAVTDKLNAAVVEAEKRASDASASYAAAQQETAKLTQELEAQRKELDTIQEAIQSRFIPLTTAEEKEHSHSAQVKDLSVQLQEMEEKYNRETSAREELEQEKEKLEVHVESLQQRLNAAVATSEKHRNMGEELKDKLEALAQKLVNLERQHGEAALQKEELREQKALGDAQIQNLQERLKSELTRIATYDTELKALHDAARQAQADCQKAREAQQEEAQRASVLQRDVQERRGDQAALLRQHAEAQEALEAEVAKLRLALREEEENGAQRAEDVSALQSELLQATQTLEEINYKEDQMNQLKTEKLRLEEEAANLSSRLLSATDESEEARREAARAREGESRARTEMEAVQEKSRAIEREIGELKERYDESLATIRDLQRGIQKSAQQTEAKDKKITELLTDVERLKQALNGLSQLAYTSNAPNKRQTQHIDTLHGQIKSLQQQLADAERQHRDVVSIYRTHLLSAAQVRFTLYRLARRTV